MNEQKTEQVEHTPIEAPVQSTPPARKPSLNEQSQKDPLPASQRTVEHPPQTYKQTSYQQEANDNRSSSRNKISVNLPYLSAQAYGDRIFDKQSASTLQKTILVYSIPKANRFNSDSKYNGEPSYCLDTCFKPSPFKGAGFGFGRKKQYPDWMERNMKENPPPGAYFESTADGKHKGRTFGISHKYYQKVLIPKEKQYTSFQTRRLSPLNDKGR